MPQRKSVERRIRMFKFFMTLAILVLVGCLVVIIGVIEDDRAKYRSALEIQADKIEALYVALTGRHGIRLETEHH
jgi:hypothetical protein